MSKIALKQLVFIVLFLSKISLKAQNLLSEFSLKFKNLAKPQPPKSLNNPINLFGNTENFCYFPKMPYLDVYTVTEF